MHTNTRERTQLRTQTYAHAPAPLIIFNSIRKLKKRENHNRKGDNEITALEWSVVKPKLLFKTGLWTGRSNPKLPQSRPS